MACYDVVEIDHKTDGHELQRSDTVDGVGIISGISLTQEQFEKLAKSSKVIEAAISDMR